MAGNSNLNKAHRNKADEFYTPLPFIENELIHYKEHFKDKIVLCNCDDPTRSAFWKYFHLNFSELGLKKLISTHYDKEEPTYKMEYTGGDDNDIEAGVNTPLEGNGDFRNKECLDVLDESDIVVTNPPFSLFRDLISLLIDKEKEFLIVGNMNKITCKEIFPLIRNNKVWLGYNNGHFWFKVPDSYEVKKTDFKIDENGQKWRRMGNICWFTNLSVEKRRENILLFREYSSELYPKYDNYDTINVDKVADIPCDYYGVMGVPITFMQYYNPDQFEIVGLNGGRAAINGKPKYARLLIKRRKQEVSQ